MHRFLRFINKTEAVCTLWIALCFSLTSAVYLSWTYHLMLFAEPEYVDIYCLVLGYAFQAAGIAISIYLFKERVLRINNYELSFFPYQKCH